MRKYWLMLLMLCSAMTAVAQTYEAWMSKANALKNERKTAEALIAYKEAISLKPNDAEALYSSAWCYNDLGKYSDALNALRIVRPQWSNVPKVFFELGYAFQKLKMNDSAKAAYDQCLVLKQDYIGAYKQLGYMAYDADKPEEAIGYFNRAVYHSKTEIQDYLFWYRRGFCENALKRYDQAIIALHQSRRYKSDYANTYLEMGFAFTKLKNNDSAIAWFNKAMELNPRDHVAYNGIAEVYRDNLKDRATAITWYQKVLAINATERKANFGMGYCLNSLQRYSEALPYLQQAIRSETTYTAAYVELGYINYKLGSYQEALKNFDKALSLNQENVNARYYGGLVYIAQKDKASAQRMVNELRGINDKLATDLQVMVDKM